MKNQRIVKAPDERRNEILDEAAKLFIHKGFDHTSTNDILDAVGIARGTLYYHFASKEDILDAIIQRMTDQAISRASATAKQTEIPILQRFTQTIMQLNIQDDVGNEILEEAHKPQNALMHQKMQERLLRDVTPLLAGLIEEGMAEGIFDTPYPLETTEMVLLYSNTAFDALAEMTGEERQRKMLAFIHNVERLFGMAKAALLDVLLPIFEASAPSPDAPSAETETAAKGGHP